MFRGRAAIEIVAAVPSFLVESYVAGAPLLAQARARARLAAELADGVSYLRTTFVPGDETCFHLFEAPSLRSLGDAVGRAALGHVRIVEAVDMAAAGRQG
jgi:hypothetical protein